MRIGMPLQLGDTAEDVANELSDLESAGLDIVFVPEAYSFDAVSQLGFLAARTKTVGLAAGIFQIYTRTPSLTAMTAAGLDFVSNGRFTLGLGASGPQVIEGFHGVRYDAPLGRTREIVDICRAVWRRERVEYAGTYYQIPLPADQGTGLGKPLKLINKPVRERIPIVLAAIGPKNVAMTAEIAEGWEPIFYLPEKSQEIWGESLAEGKAKRDASLGELDVIVQAPLAIGEDVEGIREFTRPLLALYIGGMGARGKNFYNDLAKRYGYEKEAELVQDLYLDGKKQEAAAAIPADLVERISLIGPESYVRDRVAAFAESGVTTLNVTPIAPDAAGRVKLIEQIKSIAG
jgi:F420-dependent oxidoreductase-like protein